MEIKDLEAILPCLSHFLEGDASDMLASCKQNATPETETEAETDLLSTGSADERFRSFWEQYPRKESKLDAEKAFRNLTVTNQRAALSAVGTWPFAKERNYQPLPAGWLRKQRWNDETTTGVDEDAYGGLVVR